MIRHARMQSRMQFSVLSVAAIALMVAGTASANFQFDRSSIRNEMAARDTSVLADSGVVSDGPTDLADSLLVTHPDTSTDSGESVKQIRQHMPAPHVPAEMLTKPSKTVESALPVPEPTSLALLGGLGGMLFLIHGVRAYFDRHVAR